MSKFSKAVKNSENNKISRTTNGMKAYATSNSKVLDLFGAVGSSRGKDLSAPFLAALGEDEDLAVRVLLWSRDIRGGAGERQQFRRILKTLEEANPALAGRLMPKIPALS